MLLFVVYCLIVSYCDVFVGVSVSFEQGIQGHSITLALYCIILDLFPSVCYVLGRINVPCLPQFVIFDNSHGALWLHLKNKLVVAFRWILEERFLFPPSPLHSRTNMSCFCNVSWSIKAAVCGEPFCPCKIEYWCSSDKHFFKELDTNADTMRLRQMVRLKRF